MRVSRDVGAGGLFIAVGALGLWGARLYPYGQARDMGPGYLPTALFVLMLALGVAIALRGWLARGPALPRLGSRPFALVMAAAAAFALLVERAGLVAATLAMVPLASFADRSARWRDALAAAGALALFGALVFAVGLGVPVRLWPF